MKGFIAENQEVFTQGTEWIVSHGLLLIGAIVVFWIGLKVIAIIVRYMDKLIKKAKIDKGLQHFLHSMMSIVLKIILVIIVASIIGIPMTSFIAVFGAAGLAIGLALQGSLANFAGGILILLFRPFKVGEFIEAQGVKGTVEEINIFATVLTTPQNQMISIPNGQLANGNVINYSRLKNRRLDIKVGISYDANIEEARKILLPLLTTYSHVLEAPAPQVLVENLGDSSVDLVMRAFIPIEHYWEAYFSIREQAKNALDKAGIEIPFPQTVIHMKKD
ncbi:MAG: mechanosensitive ion channel protein MscS [candidate division SR1 bacterium]|nr:MAG: mechanosensitive ion channel protein MscS [candidate division SR1 bacterium]